MNVKIIGIVVVAILLIATGMLVATGSEDVESGAWDGDTSGTWIANVGVRLEDGREVPIIVDNLLSINPASVTYGGHTVSAFIYSLAVIAQDTEGYYTEVNVRPLNSPKLRLIMSDPYTYLEGDLYPFTVDTVPMSAYPTGLVQLEFSPAIFDTLPPGPYILHYAVVSGDFQYQLEGEEWITAARPVDIFFDITVEHGEGFSISFSGWTDYDE